MLRDHQYMSPARLTGGQSSRLIAIATVHTGTRTVGWSRPHAKAFAVAIAGTLCLVASASAGGDPRLYTVDASHSWVEFHFRYLGFLRSSGRFELVTGAVLFDPSHWEGLSVTIQIPVNSLVARPEFWRQQLLSARFFAVAQYPFIDFNSEGARQTGPERGDAWGRLTLHGTTRTVVLAARVDSQVHAVDVDATSTLQRSAFGLGGSLPIASDEVTVVLHLRAFY